jgi:hypothetical protein
MMAKKDKDRLYYEVTKERPYNTFQMLMMGGSAGSVLAFFIVSLIGAYEGTEMDSLVLAFLLASFLGFFVGAYFMWFVINRLESLLPIANLLDGTVSKIPSEIISPSVSEVAPPIVKEDTSTAIENDDTKGKSIDFVFPELSPDKQ